MRFLRLFLEFESKDGMLFGEKDRESDNETNEGHYKQVLRFDVYRKVRQEAASYQTDERRLGFLIRLTNEHNLNAGL